LIKPLHLGNKTFPVNIIQGPLAGYTSAPFRLLTWKYSSPAFTCTEMISCKGLKYNAKQLYQRYIKKDPAEGPVCFQLFGNDPQDLAEATKIVTDYGADLVDLNCGCPVKKVRKQNSGSSLLTDSNKLYHLICAMKQNTHVPVSIKIRVQSNSKDKFNHEIAKVVTDAGLDFLVVHGRHWNETYQTPCHHEEIKFFVDELKIPVIGNGDVTCIASLQKMFTTGCAGVMIARACIGQPWLIQQLINTAQEKEFTPPTKIEIGKIFLLHVELLTNLLGSEKAAIAQARKTASHYARGIKHKSEFVVAVNCCNNMTDFAAICAKYFVDG